MLMIGDIFYIMLFVTTAGGVLTVLSLAASRTLRFMPPLWFSICRMAAYIIPLPAPGLYLISPEEHSWVHGYDNVCILWLWGILFFTLYDAARTLLARRAIRNYRVCDDERIKEICARCVGFAGMKKMPSIYFGTLADPACAAGVLHPAVILNEAAMGQLTDMELTAVLSHEVMHLKRKHIIWGRVYDYICILNWMNPLAWIAKKEFDVECEIDCDARALACLEGRLTRADYANTMLRLLRLSAEQADSQAEGLHALGFLLAKRRIELMIHKPAKVRKMMIVFVLAILLALTILFSLSLSRGHFFPYPAYQGAPEYYCT